MALLRLSLRSNLILLLGFVALLILGDRMREIVGERERDIADARATLLGFTRNMAEQQAALISETKALLTLAAKLPEATENSVTACQVPFRHIIAELPWIENLSIFDRNGRQVCTSR